MMATRQGDEEERAGASPKCKKDGHDPSDLSPMSPMSPVSPVSPAPVDPLFSWPGPKTLHLQRTTQGFGFTLRHFIVYPPESAVQSSFKDEDNGSRGRPRCRLEPMDTIFVKQVKEGGSAHQAGLCTGDRIVKVNGESIIGKTYSQVIALIQNSDAALELCVMPKDEDILQLFSRDITALAYSKDAYLKGNEAYSGNAQNIPEPPPILYPRVEPKTSGMTHTDEPPAPSGAQGVLSQGAEASLDMGYHMEVPITQLASPPPHSQVSRLQTVACVYDEAIQIAPADVLDSLERSPHPHRLQETKNMPLCTSSFENLSSVRPRSQTTPFSSLARGSLVQYAPKGLSDSPGFSTHIPFHPDSTSTPSSRHARSPFTPSPLTISSSPCSPMHQNIDWRNYTTYKEYIDNKRLYTYGSRTIQERLDSLRAASQEDKANASMDSTIGSQQRQRSPCHERGPANSGVQSLCSMSQERLEAKEQATSRDWHRSASQDALPLSTKSTYKPRAKSCDYLGRQAETRVMLMDRRVYGRTETEDKSPICTGEETEGCKQSLSLEKMAQTQRTMVSGCGSFPGLNATGKGTDPSSRLDSLINAASSKSQLPIQTSVLNDSYVAKALASLNTGVSTMSAASKNQRTALVPNHTSLGRRPERHRECTGSIPCLDHSRRIQMQQDGSSVATNGLAVEGLEGAEAKVVVVRREKIKKTVPLPLRHPSYIQAVNDGAGRAEKLSKTPKCWRSHDAVQDGYKQWFGEEYQLSGSGQLHESLDSIPFIDEPSSPSADLYDTQLPIPTIISAVPPSPASSSAILHRQLSHDQDSLRFTVLDSDSGAKTERSKSYDEGLDNYRDGGRGTLMKPIGLRGLRKAVDQSSDDSGSRRNSLSDVFNATKEGVLHFRQFSSDKGKRVGGGMRPWKQMYAVLRGHSLFLHKDKKEGQTPNSHMEEEPVSICIKACLIDISYSDTKRKNVLRLTTSNCEYLFQAEDREDMLAWIRAIQENSNLDEENALITSTDLINRKIKEYNTLMSPPSSKTEPSPRSSRQSLSIRHTLLGGNKSPSPHSPHKDQERKFIHKDEASPPKDKGLRRKGIPGLMRKPFEKKVAPGVTFGVRLDDCPPAHTNKFIPLIVEVCCKLVEERGLEYTGIYRVPGNNAAISSMQEELNKGVGEIDIEEDKWKDLNVISSLLKSFFRKLPDPLFTNEKYGDFIDANRTEDPVERLKVLKRLLHELPDHHYETLKFLSAHLKTVAENSEKNKMEPRNLAIVFGPTLVRTSEDNMTHMVTHMPDQYKIVETLIQQYDWFFTDEGEEEPETVVQTDSAVETQPIPNIDHLLTNIGRTGVSQGEVSDSPTSDSAKSKGSWGSGKDQYSLELVSSIFAAANRKRKKPKEKLAVSSSDDDLDAVFLESEPQNQKGIEQDIAGDSHYGKEPEKTFKSHKEHRNSFFMRKPSSGSVSESPKYSTLPSLRFRTSLSQGSPSESSSQVEDLGTLNPGTSRSRNRMRIWDTVSSSAAELPPTGPVGGSATAEVSSITSDYSTTSSMTFLTGAESSVLSADLQSRGGDEADDERSELISEGRHMETDSETEFPVFIRSATTPITPSKIVPRSADGTNVPKPLNRHVLPSQRLTAFYTSKRRSLHQKTDSESSLEVGASQEGDRMSRSEPSRLSRVLEAVKKGRSVGSLSSASSSSHSQTEPIKRLSIAERLKSHFRMSADDMFGMGGNRNSKKKEKRVRRRHTLGGHRDFGELAVINDWREQGGTEKGAELSDTERLKLQNSREISIQDWIAHERCHSGTSRAGSQGSKVMAGESSNDPASMTSCQSGTDQLNGGEQKRKGKANQNSGSDAHPHKLSGAQVVRSQFYQCL